MKFEMRLPDGSHDQSSHGVAREDRHGSRRQAGAQDEDRDRLPCRGRRDGG